MYPVLPRGHLWYCSLIVPPGPECMHAFFLSLQATVIKDITFKLCETHRLFAPRAADGDNLFAVERELLLKSLLVARGSVSFQSRRRHLSGQRFRVTDGRSPSHTVDTSPSDASGGPSGVARRWTEKEDDRENHEPGSDETISGPIGRNVLNKVRLTSRTARQPGSLKDGLHLKLI